MRQTQDLPAAPRVLQSLDRLLAGDDISIEQIAELIRLEPGLAARVVRAASSAEFGRGARVDTIGEAIQRVGQRGVRKLVSFAVASQLVGESLATYSLDAQTCWHRAVACALAAGSIAERSGTVDPNDAYTAGLMHGLGLVVIDRHVNQSGTPRTFASSGYPLDFAPAERARLGFSHAEVGGALLEQWGFSAPVATAVRYQLEPENAPDHWQLCMILATARWARSLLCVPDELIPELPSERWLELAGLKLADFSRWLADVRLGYDKACKDLRLHERDL